MLLSGTACSDTNVKFIYASPAIAFSSKQQSMKTSDNVANTLGANDYKEPQAVAIQNATRGGSQNGLGITTDGPMYW
jgi:hypothetical protein